MCSICGCGDVSVEGHPSHDHSRMDDAAHAALHAAGIAHDHGTGAEHAHHVHDHHQHSHDDIHYGNGLAGMSVSGLDQHQVIRMEKAVLAHNDTLARENRIAFANKGILALNLLSSPGSGKTTLLCETIKAIAGGFPTSVIEGDQQTSFDADRIRATGTAAIQVNTGKGCHLDAAMVADAYRRLEPASNSVLFIENVGNLVCPATFDLGEAAKVVVLSVTEGDDKPLKYPDMFAAADLLIINKVDLAPYVNFDVGRCLELARRIKPDLAALQLSATTGQGLEGWIAWISEMRLAIASRCRS